MEQLHNQASGPLLIRSDRSTPTEETFDIVQLRDRGWTRQMVTRFLGSPDTRRPASQGGGGRPAELYCVSRVRSAERLVAFSDARRTASDRSALAKRSQQERRATVLRFATNLELQLPNRRIEDVMQPVTPAERSASHTDLPVDQKRAVQLLLGMLSDSSRRLDVFQGQPGIRDARAILLDRKLALIASLYPALAECCDTVRLEPIQEYEALNLV